MSAVLLLLALSSPASAGVTLVPTAVEDPGHKGLVHWFEALKRTGSGGVARALQYGDSTIAGDGLARTVRARLAARFGDAGPGFVTASFDGRWHKRSDIVSSKTGEWSLKTILFGGAGGRYGLGGIVGIAPGGASVTAKVVAGETPVPMKHLEVWYQAGTGYGTMWAKADDAEITRTSANAAATEDRRFVWDAPSPFTTVKFGAAAGPVPFYGVVLESGKPGTTWEALGVVGVGSKSFTTFAKERLGEQMAVRKPDLVVVMLGGNEAGYPILVGNGGAGYTPIFQGALDTIRAGAPNASCLVVSPLDQGFVDEADGVAKSRPGMANLVARQRDAALASGCAFWSTWAAMGGKGSAITWSSARGIGTGDYVHVTPKGLELIGGALSDALLGAYDAWASGR